MLGRGNAIAVWSAVVRTTARPMQCRSLGQLLKVPAARQGGSAVRSSQVCHPTNHLHLTFTTAPAALHLGRAPTPPTHSGLCDIQPRAVASVLRDAAAWHAWPRSFPEPAAPLRLPHTQPTFLGRPSLFCSLCPGEIALRGGSGREDHTEVSCENAGKRPANELLLKTSQPTQPASLQSRRLLTRVSPSRVLLTRSRRCRHIAARVSAAPCRSLKTMKRQTRKPSMSKVRRTTRHFCPPCPPHTVQNASPRYVMPATVPFWVLPSAC